MTVKKANPGERRRAMLDALAKAGDKGLTSVELSRVTGVSPNVAPSALKIMGDRGLIRALPRKRKVRGCRHKMKVWVLTEVAVKHGASAVVATTVKSTVHPPEFWESIRTQIRNFIMQTRARIVDEITFRQIYREFEVDMREAVRSFEVRLQRRADTAKSSIEASTMVSRKAVFAACRVLQIEPPKQGDLVDEKLAKRNKHKLVHIYHPDAGGVTQNDSTREKYQQALDAYDTIVQYNATMKGSHNAA